MKQSWKLGLATAGTAVAVVALVVSCGADTSKYRKTRGDTLTGGGAAGPRTVDLATAGTVAGKISFAGTPPAPKAIKMGGTPECAAVHTVDVMDEKLVVNGDGTVKNCFVYVSVPGKYDPPSQPAEIDQKGCVYFPHVMGLQTGQQLNIKNSDNFLHNVHYIPEINDEQNIGMSKIGVRERSFEFAEVMIKFKCEVHPWMNAWVGVLDHPFFAVTGDDGSFSIPGVPPGTYDCVVWHESLGEQRASVTVATGQTAQADFSYSG